MEAEYSRLRVAALSYLYVLLIEVECIADRMPTKNYPAEQKRDKLFSFPYRACIGEDKLTYCGVLFGKPV